MRKVYVLVLSCLIYSFASSQVFNATYDFALVTTSSGTTDPTTPPVAPGLTFGSFTAVGTPANPNAGLRFSFTDWSLGATNGSDAFTGGITLTEYYEVTLTPSLNYSIDINSITFTLQRSGTGIRQYSVRSSLDGYSTNLPASINPANADLSVVPTNIFQVVDATTAAENGSTITLGATFDNIGSPITFRFYGWNAEAAGGTFSIDNVVFNGESTFTGTVTTFYSKPAGNLTDVLTWGTNTDGTGTSPSNFTSDGQEFNIRNRILVTLDANWTVSGAAAKVIVGDGLSPTAFIIPVAATLTGIVDVSNLGGLQLVNTTLPTFGTLSLGSLVAYSQVTSPYVVPTGTTYHHLALTSGIKTFASGTVSVNGDLIIDAVTGFNGSATPFTTLNLAGNFTLQNASAFEPIATGDGNRMTLVCIGSGTQTLSGGDFYLFRIQTPASGTVNIVQSNADVTLGNASGGGLNLLQATHTITIGTNTLTLHRAGIFSATNLGTLSGTNNSDLIIDKTAGGLGIGSIGFTTGSQELNNFTFNSTSGASTTLTLTTPLSVNNNLTMTGGLIDIGSNNLSVTGTATGSTTSYVKTSSSGAFRLNAVTATDFAPVGNNRYNPVTITNTSGHDWSIRVEDVLVVADPTFASNTAQAVLREWHITPSVNPPLTGADIIFQYDDSDPTQIGASYNTSENVQVWHEVPSGFPWGFDWIAASVSQTPTGTPGGIRTATITNWTWYSPFAISNITGPLPVKLVDFNVVKISNSQSFVTWELAACCSSAARFEIEKSFDGRNYSSIAVLPGSETNRFYHFNDTRLGKGIIYYRLKMIEATGAIAYSKVVAIINDTKGLLITSLAPNPVHDKTIMTLSAAKQGKISFRVYNLSGRLVKQWESSITEGNNAIPLQFGELAAGSYLIEATGLEARTVFRMVKQ